MSDTIMEEDVKAIDAEAEVIVEAAERFGELVVPPTKVEREAQIFSATGAGAALAPSTLTQCIEIAKLMAQAHLTVPPHLRGKPADLLNIVIRARDWGMNPFSVCEKTYMTKSKDGVEKLAYEAQLIHAIILGSGAFTKRPRFHYDGAGGDLRVRMECWLTGEDEAIMHTTPPVKQIKMKSPLWITDPEQQLGYYVGRSFARLYLPDILMGCYTRDELSMGSMGQEPPAEPVKSDFKKKDETPAPAPAPEPEPEPEPESADEPVTFELVDEVGEVLGEHSDQGNYLECLVAMVDATRSHDTMSTLLDNNQSAIKAMTDESRDVVGEAIDRGNKRMRAIMVQDKRKAEKAAAKQHKADIKERKDAEEKAAEEAQRAAEAAVAPAEAAQTTPVEETEAKLDEPVEERSPAQRIYDLVEHKLLVAETVEEVKAVYLGPMTEASTKLRGEFHAEGFDLADALVRLYAKRNNELMEKEKKEKADAAQ